MAQELIYTSAPRGLIPGSNGYCTVAMSEGLPNSWRERLESLSFYARTFRADDPRNPVVFSHLRVNGRSVLSRVSEAGLDHTGRTNHIAHHVVLDDTERPAAGPAWLLGRHGFFRESWSGGPERLDHARPIPDGDSLPGICHSWDEVAGDAGWAGALAEAFLAGPDRASVVVFDAGQALLPLFAEAVALLPPERRWDVTFSTYFTEALPGVACAWRGVLRDSAPAKQLRGRSDLLVIDLAAAGRARGGPLVEAARTGRRAAAPMPRAVRAHVQAVAPAPPAWAEDGPAVEEPPARAYPPARAPVLPPLPPQFRRGGAPGLGGTLLRVAAGAALGAAVAGGGVGWYLQAKMADASANAESIKKELDDAGAQIKSLQRAKNEKARNDVQNGEEQIAKLEAERNFLYELLGLYPLEKPTEPAPRPANPKSGSAATDKTPGAPKVELGPAAPKGDAPPDGAMDRGKEKNPAGEPPKAPNPAPNPVGPPEQPKREAPKPDRKDREPLTLPGGGRPDTAVPGRPQIKNWYLKKPTRNSEDTSFSLKGLESNKKPNKLQVVLPPDFRSGTEEYQFVQDQVGDTSLRVSIRRRQEPSGRLTPFGLFQLGKSDLVFSQEGDAQSDEGTLVRDAWKAWTENAKLAVKCDDELLLTITFY
jgi:hypothetical protein